MDLGSLHNVPLAASDIWSELRSLIVVIILFGIPAIIKALSAKNKSPDGDELRRRTESQRTYAAKRDAETTKPRRQFVSEWDHRQELIRQRLAKLKEQSGPPTTLKHIPQPAAAARPHEDYLPVAVPIQEEERSVAAAAPMPKPPVTPATKYNQIIEPGAVPYVQRAKPVSQYAPVKKTKQPARMAKTTAARVHSALGMLIAKSNPLEAGIILKEILDTPKALQAEMGW